MRSARLGGPRNFAIESAEFAGGEEAVVQTHFMKEHSENPRSNMIVRGFLLPNYITQNPACAQPHMTQRQLAGTF